MSSPWCALHGEMSGGPPLPLGEDPSLPECAQNRYEILRMLRNHYANPPTRIPITARMCRPEAGPRRELWVWAQVLASCDIVIEQ